MSTWWYFKARKSSPLVCVCLCVCVCGMVCLSAFVLVCISYENNILQRRYNYHSLLWRLLYTVLTILPRLAPIMRHCSTSHDVYLSTTKSCLLASLYSLELLNRSSFRISHKLTEVGRLHLAHRAKMPPMWPLQKPKGSSRHQSSDQHF